MSFSTLGLDSILLKTLSTLNYHTPTPIQTAAIPVVLSGKDVLARAQTGTGKTAAFVLPILQQLLAASPDVSVENSDIVEAVKPVKGLILVPTRELALQVQNSLQQYCQGTNINSTVVYGGVSIDAQAQKFAAGVDIIVATPGRLLDHLRRGNLEFSSLAFLVFDEADRMLDMGFMDEIQALLKQLPKQRQTLLFSATLDERIYKLSKSLLKQPEIIEIDSSNAAAKDIEQIVYAVDSDKKQAVVQHLISHNQWQQVLIFSRKKQTVDKIASQLSSAGVEAKAFHGDLSQSLREQVLNDFKSGEVKALVATDVAARGLDISELQYVINFELPFVAEDYIHRIGRTGRAGNKGKAITLYSEDDALLLEEVEVVLDKRLPQQWLTGFEPDLTKAEPTSRRNSKAAQKQRARKRALSGSGLGKGRGRR